MSTREIFPTEYEVGSSVWVARGWNKNLHFVCSLPRTFSSSFSLSLPFISSPPSLLSTSPHLPFLLLFPTSLSLPACMPPPFHCIQTAYQERRYSWLMLSCFLSCQHLLGWEWCSLLFTCSSTTSSSWERSLSNPVSVVWSGVSIRM